MNYTANSNRYETMKYSKTGVSGLQLPLISLGLWHNFGTNGDFENMTNLCKSAFDNGITHFDIANNYGPLVGSAEINFSKIFKDNFMPYRDEILVSTKAGWPMWEGPYGNWGSRKHLISSMDQSLKRLDLDYVDIFYHHRMDPETPIEESMLALSTIVNSGKALYVGLSNYDGENMIKASKILNELKCPFIINQNRYSIFDRTIDENGLKKACEENGKGMIAYSPLAQGLLTDKYIDGIPEDSRAKSTAHSLQESAVTPEVLVKIKALNEMAVERGQTLAQMALAWVLHADCVTSVLIGASKVSQIEDNVKMVENTSFTDEEINKIEEIVSK